MDTDTQIADYLSQKVPQFDIAAARKSGASDTNITNYLAAKVPQFDLAGARAHVSGGSATSRLMAKQNAIVAANPTSSDVTDAQGRIMTEPGAMSASDAAITAGGDHLVNSLAVGQGRRIAAAGQAAVGNGSYSANSDRFKQSLEADSRDHAGASITGDLLGVVANPLNAALPGASAESGLFGDALKAAKAANVARNAKIGAGAGALMSAGGSADDPASVVKAALFGAGTGAAGGYLLPKILTPVSKALGLGIDQVTALLRLPNPPAAARAAVSSAVEQEGGLDAFKAKLAAAGPQARVMDAGPAMRGLADQTATQSPAAQQAITDMTATRQAGQSTRVVDALNGDNPQQSAKSLVAGYKSSRIAADNSNFKPIRDQFQDVVMPKDVNDALSDPTLRKGFDKVSISNDIDANAADKTKAFLSLIRGDKVDPAQSLGLTQMLGAGSDKEPGVSYSQLSNFRSWIGDQISTAMHRSPTHTPNIALSDALTNVQHTVDDAISNVPGMGEMHDAAVAASSRGVRLQRAAEQGVKDITSGDATDIPATMAKIVAREDSPAAKQAAIDAYKKTAIAALSRQARTAGKATDLSKVFGPGSSDEMAIKAENILGPDYPAFQQKMVQESKLAWSRGVGLGSASGKRAEAGAFDASNAVNMIAHPVRGAATLLARASGAGARQAAAREVLPYLMHTGPDAIESLMSQYLPLPAGPSAAAVGGAFAPRGVRSLLDQ